MSIAATPGNMFSSLIGRGRIHQSPNGQAAININGSGLDVALNRE